MPREFTSRDVLEVMDADAREYATFFPDFDHPYIYHVDNRLTAYADFSRWAIVIEQVGVNPRAGMFAGVCTTLYFHGNCLTLEWGRHGNPSERFGVVEDGPGGPLLTAPYSEEVNQSATDVRIRGRVVPIRTDPSYYWAREIDVEVMTHGQIDEWIEMARRVMPPELADEKARWYESMRDRVGKFELNTWHLMRGLVPEHRELLLANEVERRLGVPEDLPMLLQVDEWDHPRLMEGELPSGCESFKLIAKVLASRDQTLYRPTRAPNTHWSNWKRSGSL